MTRTKLNAKITYIELQLNVLHEKIKSLEKIVDTACLQCQRTYIRPDTITIMNKHMSRKCNHHFCDSCIDDWRRVGWDDNVNVKTRTRINEPDIPTKKCLYPSCTVQHDRLPNRDTQRTKFSYVIDK